jgi:hypothetical protein
MGAERDRARCNRAATETHEASRGPINRTNEKEPIDMATARKVKKSDISWDDFRPEWASEGIERISQELEKWNDDLQTRSAKFRKESRKRIDKSVKQVQTELRKLPALKRAEEFRSGIEKRVDQGVDRVYTSLKLARLDEVKKLERKIAQLNKKLRDLEKEWTAA